MLLVDLGSGRQAMEVPNHVHIDIVDLPHIEWVWDLNYGLPKVDMSQDGYEPTSSYNAFDDNTIDEFRAHHIFEHIEVRNFIPLLNEIWDALKAGGVLKIYVPNGHHIKAAWSDPTHVRCFTIDTFGYFTREGYNAFAYTDKIWHYIKEPTINGEPNDQWEIECWLSPDK